MSAVEHLTAGCGCWGCTVEIPRLLRALAIATAERRCHDCGGRVAEGTALCDVCHHLEHDELEAYLNRKD